MLAAPDSRRAAAVAIGVVTTVMFAAYGIAVAAVWRRPSGRRGLLLIGAVSVIALLFSAFAFPNANSDIYSYIASGRVAAVHGANPYVHPPSDFPSDPLLPYVSERYSGNVSSKLPAWMLINVPLARVSGDDPVTVLLVYRLVLTSFAIASIAFVALTLRRVAPRHAAAGIVGFGWNPIFVVYGPTKTDTVMVFFLLLGAVCIVRGRPVIAAAALTLSALVKLITLPLVGFWLLRDARLHRWRQFALALVVSCAVVVLAYLPFTTNPALLFDHLRLVGAVESAEGVNRSDEATLETAIRVVVALALLALVLWRATRQDATVNRLFFDWAIIAVCFSVFLTTRALPWYQLVPLATVALSASAPLAVVMGASTFGSFALGIWYSASSQAFPLGDVFSLPQTLVYLILVSVTAIVVAVLALRRDLVPRRLGPRAGLTWLHPGRGRGR